MFKNVIGFSLTWHATDLLRRRLNKECQQAWLTWRRLPDCAADLAAAERITDAETEAMNEAASNRFVKAYTKKRNAKWLEWYKEFIEDGHAEPNVAILNRWNALSDKERLEIAGNKRGSRKLPCETSSEQTRALNTIKQALYRVQKEAKWGDRRLKTCRCLRNTRLVYGLSTVDLSVVLFA